MGGRAGTAALGGDAEVDGGADVCSVADEVRGAEHVEPGLCPEGEDAGDLRGGEGADEEGFSLRAWRGSFAMEVAGEGGHWAGA